MPIQQIRNIWIKSTGAEPQSSIPKREPCTKFFCILSPGQIFFRKSGPWFSIKMPSYQYRNSHRGDKTVVRSSYLHYGISYTGKMASFYWIRTLICKNASFVDKYSKVTYACLASFILSAYSVVSANYLSSWGNNSTCDRTNITSRQAVYTFLKTRGQAMALFSRSAVCLMYILWIWCWR